MSAKDQIAQMLDELMGTTRNGEESSSSYRFDDRSVCRAFLLGCCPYVLLAQTVSLAFLRINTKLPQLITYSNRLESRHG